MFFNKEFIKFIEDSKQKKLDIVCASVVKTLGHTYAKAGNMLLINSKEEFVGVLGSDALHSTLLKLAKKSLEENKNISHINTPKHKDSFHGESQYLIQPLYFKDEYNFLLQSLKNENKTLVRSINDNSYEFLEESFETKLEDEKFFQVIKKPYSLLIFGSGAHVNALVNLANAMMWETTVIDKKLNEPYVKDADNLIEIQDLQEISSINFNAYDASVILSHSPSCDDIYLDALLKSKMQYIGILGNKSNMQRKKKLFNLEEEKRFFAPVGFDIGGNTSHSIALSICSQIEARKNMKI